MAQQWYYASDGEQRGPISAAELKQLATSGALAPEDLVWAEGMKEWAPARTVKGLFTSAGAGFSSEGAPPPPPPGGSASTGPDSPYQAPQASLTQTARGSKPSGVGTLDLGACIGRSWNLLTNNLGLLLVMVLLYLVIVAVVSSIGRLLGGDDAAGVGIQLSGGLVLYGLITTPLLAGMFVVFLKLIRGEEANISDMFTGFKKSYVQLMLVGWVTYLLQMVGFVFCILPGIFLVVIWMYAIPTVIDRKLEFWDAMEVSRKAVQPSFFMHLLLLIVLLIVGLCGLLACGVGILFTMPLVLGALACAYEEMIGSR